MEHTEAMGSAALTVPRAGAEADSLRRLAEVVAGTADLGAAIRDVNRLVAGPLGLRVGACALTSPHLRAATSAPAPDAFMTHAVELWRAAQRHGTAVEPEPARGDAADDADAPVTLVPVVHRHRIHGVATVVGRPPADAAGVLSAIGLAFGEVAWKAGARRELARSRRRLAIAVEQERTARDVQHAVHHRLALLGRRLASHMADAPDRVWRERLQELLLLTGEVDRDVRQSLNVLRALPNQTDDLPASLRALARAVHGETGLYAKVFVQGPVRRLPAAKVEALFHVAVEALVAAALGARADYAVIAVDYRADEVRLAVRDDGVGPAHRQLFARPGSEGIRGLQERLARLGGTVRVHALRPRGASVEAAVPHVARRLRPA